MTLNVINNESIFTSKLNKGDKRPIIPLKERVVDKYYDPVLWLYRKIFKRNKTKTTK